MAGIKIIQNTDGTITVKNGRKVAHTDVRGMTLAEAIEHIYWAAMGVNIVISRETVWDALR